MAKTQTAKTKTSAKEIVRRALNVRRPAEGWPWAKKKQKISKS